MQTIEFKRCTMYTFCFSVTTTCVKTATLFKDVILAQHNFNQLLFAELASHILNAVYYNVRKDKMKLKEISDSARTVILQPYCQ